MSKARAAAVLVRVRERSCSLGVIDCVSSAFLSPGTLEDWDLAIQKTETRLARVNEQRMKVTAMLPEGW